MRLSSIKISGNEGETAFAILLNTGPVSVQSLPQSDIVRQGRESLKFFAQLSYLMMPDAKKIAVNLSEEKAADLFRDLAAVSLDAVADPEEQISNLASLFAEGTNEDFGFVQTDQDIILESGFKEGTKTQKTHLVIERNGSLRIEYFKRNPTATCDVCTIETIKTYPWTNRVLDLHHILPLSSGVEVDKSGTKFNDLKPVCPTCHRAVHKHYSDWLKQAKKPDFTSREEAFGVYDKLKQEFKGVMFNNA